MRHGWSQRSFLAVALVGTAVLLLSATPASAAGQRINEPKYGFSFSLPPKFVPVPLNGSDISGLLATATKNDPALENALSSQVKAAAQQGIKFFALGPVTGTVNPNINIYVASSAGAPTGSAFISAADAQAKMGLTQAGMKSVNSGVVKFPIGKTLVVTYSIPVSGGASPAYGVQTYLQHKGYFEVVTFTSGSLASSESSAKMVMNSWHWS
jgi:hypothetical protein